MVVLLTQEFPGVSRENAEEVSKRVHSSLKERAGVKRGWPAVFAVAAGLQGMMA